MAPEFKNVGERSIAKIYRPSSLFSVVSKVFEKLVNNRIVEHLEKCGLFSSFQYGFRRLRVVLDGKSSEYPVNAVVPQASILGSTLFLLYINDLAGDICNIPIYTDDTTLQI